MISLRQVKDKYIIYFIFVLTILSELSTVAKGQESGSTNIYQHVDADETFSWNLLRNVLEGEQTNVVISPFAIKIVLAVLSEAAGDNTRTQKQLIEALDAKALQPNSRESYKEILASLTKENRNVTLNLETRMFTDDFIKPAQKYEAILAYFYDTDIERLNFADAPASANRINSWCKNVTNGQLKDLVTEENIKNSMILLTNVIYFNGFWFQEFNKAHPGVFHTAFGTESEVQYMQQDGMFYHSNDENADLLRLPYKDTNLSMYILLPKTNDGLDKLINYVQNGRVNLLQSNMTLKSVNVALPKFNFKFQKNFKNTLSGLGINDIFTDDASLPGLSRNARGVGNLKVSDIIQKAGIDVNERGTEAYAATVVELTNKFGEDAEVFTANHPFIFFIQEDTIGSILFGGKVVDPAVSF